MPLCLFGIAQTLAIYGKKRAFLLSLSVILGLCVLAFTGFSPIMLGAVLAIVSVPFFLIVSILRQKRTSIFWSAAILIAPILIFFGAVISAPSLNQEQYESEITKIENTLVAAKAKDQANKNTQMYDKTLEQMEVVKRDPTLRTFMNYNINERLIYFVYGNGFSVLLGILLSFFASLFFLDFAFEQVEKFKAIKRYVHSSSTGTFEASFLLLLKSLTFKDETDDEFSQTQKDASNFKIIKHTKPDYNAESEKRIFGLFRKPRSPDTITLREYVFHYAGKMPGWNLRTYQMPLILCLLSIIVLSSTAFYFGSVQGILNAVHSMNLSSTAVVVTSVLSICAVSFLVLQGIFTTLKWVPFGVLLLVTFVFLIISPYIMFDMGPFVFLGFFGVIGLLGYLI